MFTNNQNSLDLVFMNFLSMAEDGNIEIFSIKCENTSC